MTEEIIIDCAFYKDGVCASPINKTCEYCKNIDVSKCYHKQLKRLEQKNDKLKKDAELDKVQLEAYFIGEELLVKENQRLRSALEEIRKIADNVSDTFDTPMVLAVKIQNKINEVLGNEG